MENSKQQLDRQTKTRIELINEAKEGQCVEGCYGQWLTCAKEALDVTASMLSIMAGVFKIY